MVDPKVPRPLTPEQLNPLLDDYLKAAAGTPREEKARKAVAALRELKSHEAEYRANIAATIDQVRGLVIPQPHMVKIQLAAPSTNPATAPAASALPSR